MGLQTMTAVALMMVGCMFLAGQADAFTKLWSNVRHPDDKVVYVPKHEDFRVQCATVNYIHKSATANSSEYHHRLYLEKGVGEKSIPLNISLADGCETVTNHTVKKHNATYATVEYLFTIFRLKAEDAGSFTYGCKLVAGDARDNGLDSSPDLTAVVCSEPHFRLNREEENSMSELDRPADEGNNATLNTEEKCGFNGAVSYLVNGVPVPRKSSGDASSHQAVELDDSSLEIHSPVCVVGPRVCNVTAQFTYIFEGNIETSYSRMSLNDCCIDVGAWTTPMPTKVTASSLLAQLAARANITQSADVMESIGEDPLVAERKQLEISKLELEIEVLKLKTELIPLQILGRQHRIKDVSKRLLLVDEEEDATALPV